MALDGKAIVYCDGAFNTPNGKTAHGLVRFTERYDVLAVIDRRYAGQDAGEVLDGKSRDIPLVDSLEAALKGPGKGAKYFVIGIAPDGGRLSLPARETVKEAIGIGLNIDCGLHDFLTEDPVISTLAREKKIQIRDVRKPPERSELHFFTGRIEEVKALKIAMLGTDSAVGKRTSAWILVHALRKLDIKTELIGTGQTAWMQGAKYGVVMDSLINDFVSGEIEHAVVSAWDNEKPQVIVIEGQGSIMNPAYPGGFEILAAGRPDLIFLQHAPMREDYDGFPGYRLHPLPQQIAVLEMLSGKKVAAITLNHEEMKKTEIDSYCRAMSRTLGLPVYDPLFHGGGELARLIKEEYLLTG